MTYNNSNIIRIDLPTIFEMKTVNCYLIKGPEIVLVDCGEYSKKSVEALQKALQEHGIQFKDIAKVYITHAHVDHIGMAGYIAEMSDVEIWVNAHSYDWAYKPFAKFAERNKLLGELIQYSFSPKHQQFLKGGFENFGDIIKNSWIPVPQERLKTYESDGHIRIGGVPWKVIYAPGHSYTQCCFYNEASKELLSADMILKFTPTTVIELDPENPTKRLVGIKHLLNSFEELYKLDVEICYPGHYENILKMRELINYQMSRIQKRKAECLELIKNGTHDLVGLYLKMYKGNGNLPGFNMLIAYLDLLWSEDKISVTRESESLRYQAM